MSAVRLAFFSWAAGLAALSSAGCSGGHSGGHAAPSYYEVWIDPADTPTTHSVASLYGAATCDACPPSESLFGTCPPIQGPFDSAIGIHWTNLTTGESGDAVHGIYGQQSWFFSYCTVSYSHRWFASVPLAFGPNEIEVIAMGPSANPGTEQVTVTRLPEAPQGLVAQPGPTDVVLSWSPVASAESYDLVWSTGPDVSLPDAQVITGVVSPFVDSAPADTVRYYAVRAVAGGYPGTLSQVVFATVGWIPETVPLPAMVTSGVDLALAVDSTGHAHVHVSRLGTLANPWIYNDYATNAGGSWTWLAVSQATDLGADVALAADDSVRISYIETWGAYAVQAEGSWVTETFDTAASCYTSLAVDGQGHGHVLYQQNQFVPTQTGLVRYATNAGGTWLGEVVGDTRFGCYQEGSKLALALDSEGHAHVLHLPGPSDSGLRYATDGTGAWESESVTADYVRSLALALDPGGTPHAVWTDDSNALRHAVRVGPGSWLTEVVDGFAFGPSIAIGPAGDVHVSYVQYALGQLRYAKRAAGQWHLLPIAPATWAPTAIALDWQGLVHIAWFDGDVEYVAER